MPAACSHVWTRPTGRIFAPLGMTISPLPCLVGLRPPDRHPEPIGDLLDVLDPQRHELGPPERAGEPEGEKCAVALAQHGVGAERRAWPDPVRGGRGLALLCRADGAPDSAQDRPHPLLARGRLERRLTVPVGDRRHHAADAARLPARSGEVREVGRHDAHMGRERRGAPGMAPDGEVLPVAGVARPGGGRLLRLRVGHGLVDLGIGERAGRHRAERGSGRAWARCPGGN